jgi:MFS transporter, putative metabolite:H+ symporter
MSRWEPYQRRLLLFLSVATFFEGYDFFALSQLLPRLRHDFELSPAQGAVMNGVINAGTVLAYLIVDRADRWGRKRVLTVTIVGYTLFTLLSGLALGPITFTICQVVARVFLIGEWATSMVIAAEEFPAERRGTVIGIISAAAGFGSIVCAGVVPLLLKTPFGWRSVYFAGVIPLLLIAWSRRSLRETRRFEERGAQRTSLLAIWKTPHKKRILQMGSIWFLCYICAQNAVTFWKDFALNERGLSEEAASGAIVQAALVGMAVAFAAGRFLDAVGRKLGGSILIGCMAVGVFAAYTAEDALSLKIALCIGMIGINTMLTVLNTFTTELFPTEQRAAAFAWSNNLIGRIGYWLSPFVIALLVDLRGFGEVVRWTAPFPLLAIVLIWLFLPETNGQELEQSAKLE